MQVLAAIAGVGTKVLKKNLQVPAAMAGGYESSQIYKYWQGVRVWATTKVP